MVIAVTSNNTQPERGTYYSLKSNTTSLHFIGCIVVNIFMLESLMLVSRFSCVMMKLRVFFTIGVLNL